MSSVDHPKHYNNYTVEAIEMMIKIWGEDKAFIFCELNAFKYRMRAGLKGDFAEDLAKEQWYLNKMDELRG